MGRREGRQPYRPLEHLRSSRASHRFNGYPIGLGNLPSQGYASDTFVFTHNGGIYPTGVYTLTFDGDGTVEIINGNQPAQVFSQAGGLGSPSNVYITSTNNNGIVIAIRVQTLPTM